MDPGPDPSKETLTALACAKAEVELQAWIKQFDLDPGEVLLFMRDRIEHLLRVHRRAVAADARAKDALEKL